MTNARDRNRRDIHRLDSVRHETRGRGLVLDPSDIGDGRPLVYFYGESIEAVRGEHLTVLESLYEDLVEGVVTHDALAEAFIQADDLRPLEGRLDALERDAIAELKLNREQTQLVVDELAGCRQQLAGCQEALRRATAGAPPGLEALRAGCPEKIRGAMRRDAWSYRDDFVRDGTRPDGVRMILVLTNSAGLELELDVDDLHAVTTAARASLEAARRVGHVGGPTCE